MSTRNERRQAEKHKTTPAALRHGKAIDQGATQLRTALGKMPLSGEDRQEVALAVDSFLDGWNHLSAAKREMIARHGDIGFLPVMVEVIAQGRLQAKARGIDTQALAWSWEGLKDVVRLGMDKVLFSMPDHVAPEAPQGTPAQASDAPALGVIGSRPSPSGEPEELDDDP